MLSPFLHHLLVQALFKPAKTISNTLKYAKVETDLPSLAAIIAMYTRNIRHAGPTQVHRLSSQQHVRTVWHREQLDTVAPQPTLVYNVQGYHAANEKQVKEEKAIKDAMIVEGRIQKIEGVLGQETVRWWQQGNGTRGHVHTAAIEKERGGGHHVE